MEEAKDEPAVTVSTSTEPSTPRMSDVHGSDVENGKQGSAIKPEVVSTSVATLDEKTHLKTLTSVTSCSVHTTILPTAVESQQEPESNDNFAELVIDANVTEDVSNSQRHENETSRFSYMPTRELEPLTDIKGGDLETTVLHEPAAETATEKWEQHYKISVPALVGQEDPGMDTGSPATQPDVLPPPHTGKKLLTNRSIKFSDSQHWELELDQQLGSSDNAAHTIWEKEQATDKEENAGESIKLPTDVAAVSATELSYHCNRGECSSRSQNGH